MKLFKYYGLLSFLAFAITLECETPQELINKASAKIEQEIQKSGSVSIDDFGTYLFDKLPLPGSLDKALRKLVFKNGKLNKNITALYDGFQVLGDAKIFNTPAKISILYGKEGVGTTGASCTITFPDNWNYAQLDKKLAFLDKLTLLKPRITISTTKYDDPETNQEVPKGLSIIADVDLVGLLAPIGKVFNLIKKLPGVQLQDAEKIYLRGHLPAGLPTGANFTIILPVKFGVDFKELHRQKKLPMWPKPIESIEVDGFSVSVTPTLSFSMDSAMNLELSTRKEPLEFSGGVEIERTTVSIDGALNSTVEFFKGLKLSNLGLELAADAAITATTGIPISGLGFRGEAEIGIGKDMASVEVAAKLILSTSAIPKFALIGIANNVTIRALTSMVGAVAKKNIVVPKELDFLKLHHGKVYIIPGFSVKVAGKSYEPGFHLSAFMSLLGVQGEMAFYFDKETVGLTGLGRLGNIDVKVLKLTGPGLDGKYNTKDDGPIVTLDFRPLKKIFNFSIDGIVEIPNIVRKAIKLKIGVDGVTANFTEKMWGLFETEFELTFGLSKPKEFRLYLRAEHQFGNLMKKLREAVVKRRAKVREDMDKLKNSMDRAKRGFEGDVDQEIERVNGDIAILKKERARLKKKMKRYPTLRVKLWGVEVAIQGAIAYRDGLVKGGSKVAIALGPDLVKGLANGIKAFEGLFEELEKVLDKITGVIIVKRVEGLIRGDDIKAGKLPKVIVTFENNKQVIMQLDSKRFIKDLIEVIKKI